MQSSTKTQSKIIETITQMLKSSPNSFKTLVECIPHLNPTIIPSIISSSSLSTDPNTLLSFYKWCQTHIPNFTNPSTSLLPPLIRFKTFTDTKSILLSFIAQDDKHLLHDRLIHPPRNYPTPSKSLLDTPLLPVCFAFAVFELRLHLFQMSPSSRFLHSISKTLNLHTSSALLANQSYRICKPNSSFTSPLLSSQRSLSTIAESPLPLPSEARGKDGGGLSRWLLFFPGAITFGLGTWQIVRRQDKIEMLEFRRSRLGLEPLDLTSISSSLNEEPGPLEFRRVLCEGVFDDNKSIYMGPRSRSISGVTENGYYVITPLMPVPDNPASVQAPILVNRGWVPRSWRDKFLENSQDDKQHSPPESPHAGENEGSTWWKFWSRQAKAIKDQGPVTTPEKVIGVIRESEKPSIFVPTNDPSSGQWFYVDVPMIIRACGLPENTVYIEDIHDNIDPSKPYPLPKDFNTLIRSSVMPQDHLNYMLTWYSLSAAVTFMAYKRLKTRKSRK